MKLSPQFFRSKTVWTQIGAIVGVIGMTASGLLTYEQAGAAIWSALTVMFLRDGMNK